MVARGFFSEIRFLLLLLLKFVTPLFFLKIKIYNIISKIQKKLRNKKYKSPAFL